MLLGIGVGIGKVPYLAGAAASLAGTALRVVNTAALSLEHLAQKGGAPHRAIEGAAAAVAVLVPGATALVLLLAARVTLVLRSVAAVLLGALGLASFAYLSTGRALGVTLLALAAAGLLVAASGPLVAAPLAALAALIGTTYLPKLLEEANALPTRPVTGLHEALFASAGSPAWLAVLVLLLAAVPFLGAARLLAS